MAMQLCLTWNNHTGMMNEFKTFLLSEDMVDVTLSCEGRTLKAHKLILSACSPFFRALFLENPCKHPIVILNDVKYSDLKAIVEYIYFGEVKVNVVNLPALMKIAQTLKVKGLGELKSDKNRSGNESESQTMDESESQPVDETESQLLNELESQVGDRSENECEDESEMPGDETENQLEDEAENLSEIEAGKQTEGKSEKESVDEAAHRSVLKVNLSNCKLTREQLAGYKKSSGTPEPQIQQGVLCDDNISLKNLLLQLKNQNSSLGTQIKQPPKQRIDVGPSSIESSEPNLLKRALTLDYKAQQSCQSYLQPNTGQQKMKSVYSFKVHPVRSLYMSSDGSALDFRRTNVSPVAQGVEVRTIKEEIVEKPCESENSAIVESNNSRPKRVLKESTDAESTNGKVKTRRSNSSSLQPSLVIAQVSPDLTLKDGIYNDCKTFSCKYCNFMTTIEKNFALHMEFHLKNKPKKEKKVYNCDMCSYNTLKRDYFKKHLTRKHKLKNVQV